MLLMVASFGIWMLKKWGLISGLIFYVLGAAGGITSIIENEVTSWQRHGTFRPPDMNDIWVTFVSVFMAAVLNSLRKRVRRKRLQKMIDVVRSLALAGSARTREEVFP